MAKKEYTFDSARRVLEKAGAEFSGNKITLKGAKFDRSKTHGGATVLGAGAWGAVDYLVGNHKFHVSFDTGKNPGEENEGKKKKKSKKSAPKAFVMA